MTGVAVLQTGSTIAKPVIHGLHSNRLLILNNGIRQEGQQWGSEHAPEIDPFIATSLKVIKGANTVRYGSGAMAGVIVVEPGELRDSTGIGGEVNLVGFSNGRSGTVSGIIEGRPQLLPNWGWRVQDGYISIGMRNVARQNRVPADQDFTDPPDGFSRIHAKAGVKIPMRGIVLHADFTVDNLLNTTYRNYLNRFRYFADEMGRNVSLKLRLTF
jgi:outer membrane receptor protein involved in Fe transport